MENRIANPDLTYEEALAAVARARVRQIMLEVSVNEPPYPAARVDPTVQVKIATVSAVMALIGRMPGDFPQGRFDRPIRFRLLSDETLTWLEQSGIPARRNFAPLATPEYIRLFGTPEGLPVPMEAAGRFWGRLAHWLTIELGIMLAKQYYHGLGLYEPGIPMSVFYDMMPEGMAEGARLGSLPVLDFEQLHGLIFLEYCAVMIRAQWDKLIRLSCLVFGIRYNWGSIREGLAVLEQAFDPKRDMQPWCRYHGQLLVRIAQDRLSEGAWLKHFRDSLLHDVGDHPAGVAPHRSSLETTSEIWDRVCDEHDWIREAMVAALASFVSKNLPATN